MRSVSHRVGVRLGLAVLVGSWISACTAILGDDFEVVETTPTGVGGSSSAGGSGATGTAGGSGGSGGGAALSLTLSAQPDGLRIVRGSSAGLQVDVVRGGDVGDVTVSLGGLPTGVTCEPVVIAAAETSATLTVDVAAQASLGHGTASLADQAALATPVDVSLLVADPPGVLDETFDSDGVLNIQPAGGDNAATAVYAVEQADGQLVVGGTLTGGAASGWAVMRFATDGTPDTGFNDNATSAMPASGELNGVALDPATGRVVATGVSGPGTDQLTVVRLNTNGSTDSAFGGTGSVRLSSITYQQGTVGAAVIVQPDSRIVAAGAENTSPSRGLVVRLESNGALDSTFGSSGVFLDGDYTRFESALLDPTGNVVAAGTFQDGVPPRFWVTRLTGAGVKDGTFGTAGSVSIGSGVQYGREVVRQSDGHLVVCGYDSDGYVVQELARLDAAGTTAWASPGSIEYTIHSADERAYGCAVQADGQILFAGWGQSAGLHDGNVTRVDTAGVLDSSFSDDGSVIFQDPNGPPPPGYTLYDVMVQADGRIVVVGNQTDAGWFIARIWN